MFRNDVDLQIAGTTDVSNGTFSHFLVLLFDKIILHCVVSTICDAGCLC